MSQPTSRCVQDRMNGLAHPERVRWSRAAYADDLAVIEEAVPPGSAASERDDEGQWRPSSATVLPGTVTGRERDRDRNSTKHDSARSVTDAGGTVPATTVHPIPSSATGP